MNADNASPPQARHQRRRRLPYAKRATIAGLPTVMNANAGDQRDHGQPGGQRQVGEHGRVSFTRALYSAAASPRSGTVTPIMPNGNISTSQVKSCGSCWKPLPCWRSGVNHRGLSWLISTCGYHRGGHRAKALSR